MVMLFVNVDFSTLYSFINTKKAFKKLYMFYFETFRIILNPSSVKNPSSVDTLSFLQFSFFHTFQFLMFDS